MKKYQAILFIFLALSASYASAALQWYNSVQGSSVKYPSPLDACNAVLSAAMKPGSVSRVSDTSYKCNDKNGTHQDNLTAWGSCDAGTTFNPVTGTCSSPTTTTTTTTTTNPCPASGTVSVSVPSAWLGADGRPIGSLFPAPSGTYSYQGCMVAITPQGFTGTCTSTPGGPWPALGYCTYNATHTGVQGSGSPLPDAPPAPNTTPDNGKCPKGTISGGVDSSGIPICIGSKTDSVPDAGKETTSKPPPVTNPDGSTTETETKERVNSDGSKTTTTTTTETASNGQRTVTVTQSTSAKPTGEKGQDDKNTDFCEKNPQLTICKNSTVSGSCESTSCEGDAIQCEILRQQRKQYCEDRADTPESNLGKSLLSGNDPMKSQIDQVMAGEERDFSSTSLDQSGFIGGGSCLANRSFTAFGQTIEMNFTSVCNNLAPARYGVLAMSFIVAYLIVARSVLQGTM